MHRPALTCLALLACLAFVAPATAAQRAMLRAQDGAKATLDHGLSVRSSTPTPNGDLLVVELAPGQTASSLRNATNNDPNVLRVESVGQARLQAAGFAAHGIPVQEQTAQLQRLAGTQATPCIAQHLSGGEPWAGWPDQYAAALLDIERAQQFLGHCGEGAVVAIIDTGVDAEHPLLEGAVLPGYDFILNQGSLSSEWSNLDNSFHAIVENSFHAIVENSFHAIVEGHSVVLEKESIAVFLAEEDTRTIEDLDLPPLFGHGTMVAGLVRLVAPGADILPLRAFDGDGNGDLDDIVRAVYYAVDQGADVINMSFGLEKLSTELTEALRYARSHGVVTVAAVGNQGKRDMIYPAAQPETQGVLATDSAEQIASFSNHGSQLADIAAPGVALVSAYPGGHYAAGWGTSFATPLVAGTAALLAVDAVNDVDGHQHLVLDLLFGSQAFSHLYGEALSSGRVDAYGAAVEAAN